MPPSLSRLMSLEGRAALITGGAGHIGSALALALAQQGAAVALVDIDGAAAAAQAAEIGAATGATALGLACDLADEAALRATASEAVDRLGGLAILINCAAFVGTTQLDGWAEPFERQGAAAWRAALEVNLTAPFILSQALAPALRASGHGSIINVGSIYGELGPDMRLYEGTAMANPAAYGASKGGLAALTRHLATILAPEVRVNTITLGGVWRGQPQAFVARYEARTPLGRMAKEEDFVGAAVFLAGDMSTYVTGSNLVIDGGFSAW